MFYILRLLWLLSLSLHICVNSYYINNSRRFCMELVLRCPVPMLCWRLFFLVVTATPLAWEKNMNIVLRETHSRLKTSALFTIGYDQNQTKSDHVLYGSRLRAKNDQHGELSVREQYTVKIPVYEGRPAPTKIVREPRSTLLLSFSPRSLGTY